VQRVRWWLVGTVTCLLLSASSAQAQNGGLFGATRPDTPDRFNFLGDIAEGYETELPPEFRSRLSQNDLQSGGFSTLFVGSADYAHNGRLVQFGASGLTAYKYYQRIDRLAAVSHTVGVGATVALPKQFALQVNQTAAYAPSYLYGLFPVETLLAPGNAILADPDYRTDESASQSYATNVSLAFTPARGTKIAATADYRHTKFDRHTGSRFDNTFYATGANFSRSVSRNVNLTAAYQYRTAEFRADELTREHSGTVGVQYSRPLSRTRRVTYRLDVAPASLEIPQDIVNEIAVREGLDLTTLDARVFRFQVEGGVDYDVRLNWKLTADYRRGVEYLAVLTEPIFADGVRVALTGLITRRIDLSSSAGYASGESTVYGGANGLNTYTGNVRLRYAVKQPLAVYSEYLFYQYDLRGHARIAPDLPAVFKQHVIRVGVMLFASLDR
jgi:hypothetical protein